MTNKKPTKNMLANHPRLADIKAAQPPLKTLKGVGNYNQYSKHMLSNGRKR